MRVISMLFLCVTMLSSWSFVSAQALAPPAPDRTNQQYIELAMVIPWLYFAQLPNSELTVGGEETDFCGSVQRVNNPPSSECIVSDRFGNCYTYDEVSMPPANPTSLGSGPSSGSGGGSTCGCDDPMVNVNLTLFDLTFQDCVEENGIGFNSDADGAKRRTVCRAFEYLESLIVPNVSDCSGPVGFSSVVSVDIRVSDHPELPANAVGAASAYYPYDQEDYGTITGFPWQVINGDVEAFATLPLMFHGYIMFRASSSSSTTFDGWYTDETTTIPSTSNLWDLYTVTLHEAMHMLGFSSNIGAGGLPVQALSTSYDRFDSFLRLDDGTPNGGTSVIANVPTGSYDWQLNVPANSLHNSCIPANPGPNMVFRTGNNTSIPVYTGAIYLGGGSFSHLAQDCDPTITEEFVMRRGLEAGEAVPVLSPSEMEIFCSIGYTIQDQGSNVCGCTLAGVDDTAASCGGASFIVEICPGEAPILTISVDDLIANDPGADGIAQFEPFGETDGDLVVDGSDPDLFIFTPERFGIHRLRYIPTSTTCNGVANETYVYINAVPGETCGCDFFDGTEANCGADNYGDCNLICNPEYCANVVSPLPTTSWGLPSSTEAGNIELPGWEVATGTPDYNTDNISSSLSISNSGLLHFSTTLDVNGVPHPGLGRQESITTAVSALPGNYLWSTYWFVFNTETQGEPGMNVYLVDQQVKDDYFYDPMAGSSVLNSLQIEAEIAGQGNHLNLGSYPVFDNGTSAGFAHLEKRVGNSFTIDAGEAFDFLWFVPQLGENPVPDEIASGAYFNRSLWIDQVELIRDDFAAQADQAVQCGESVILQAADFCMLSDVQVQYQWVEDDGGGNLTPILTYSVEKELDGNHQILDADGNILLTVPGIAVTPNQNTRYVLQRSVLEDGGIDGLTFTMTEDEVLITVQALTLPTDFSVETCNLEVSVVAGSTGNIHSWGFGDGTTAEGEFATHTYATAGTYTITHYIGIEGCLLSESEVVTIPDVNNAPQTAGFMTTISTECEGALTPLILAADDPNWHHSYVFPDGMTFSGPEVSLNLGGGTYSIVHTVSNDCGTLSETQSVTIPICLDCEECDPAGIVGTDGTTTLLSVAIANEDLPAGGASNTDYCIAGELVVDANSSYSFNNCTIQMLPGASIRVEQGAQLMIGTNSIFFSCDELWQGFSVDAGATFTMSRSTIANAYHALHVDAAYDPANPQVTEVFLGSNQLYNNFIGVFVSEAPLYNTLLLQLNQNTFSTMEDLLPTGSVNLIGTLPVPNQRSFAGVIMNDVPLAASNANTFDGLTIGIWCIKSSIGVADNTFSNMQVGVPFYPTINNRGIGFVNERADEGLYHATVEGCNFRQCRIGIASAYASLYAVGNEMNEVETGISMTLPNMGPVKIGGPEAERNTIHASRNGILAAGFATNSEVQINNNLITLAAATGRRGIQLASSQSDEAEVMDNEINLEGSGRGLELLMVENTRVEGNTVNLLDAPLAEMGICLRAADHILLHNNTVTGSATTGDDDHNVGLEVFSSSDIGYCCNTFDNTRVGVRVRGSSLSTDQFRGTIFGDHSTGLRIDDNAVLGTQSHMENRWTGTYDNGIGAVYDVSPSEAQDFLFLVDADGSNGASEFAPTASPNVWFQLDENTDVQDYCQQNDCDFQGYLIPGPDDEYIVRGGNSLTPYTAAIAWQLQQNVLTRYQAQAAYPSNLISFIQSVENSSVGSYAQYRSDVADVFKLNPADRIAVNDYFVLKATELETLVAWEAGFNASGAIALGTQALSSRLSLTNTARQTSEDARLLVANIISVQQSLAATLLATDLASNESYTQNAETTYQKQLALGLTPWLTPSSADILALDAVANQCPLDDGNAVFAARAQLAFLDDPSITYDQVDCGKKEALQRGVTQEVEDLNTTKDQQSFQFNVYPNPIEGRKLWVAVPAVLQTAHLELFSAEGVSLQKWRVPLGENKIQLILTDLPQGLYLLNWSDGDNQLNQKIILK